uniref:Uncharacterized protein n=1 Tax=Globodera rostochiensis TaxID=31243 RepID=A0A914HHH2_GLORO
MSDNPKKVEKRLKEVYIDRNVIKFLQSIRPLFASKGTNVPISAVINQTRSWQIIWPLINDNICCFVLFLSTFKCLRRFSPTFLRDCAKLQLVKFYEPFPVFSTDNNAMAKWLHTPRGDGLPMLFECNYCSERMEGLKMVGFWVSGHLAHWTFGTLVKKRTFRTLGGKKTFRTLDISHIGHFAH